MASISKLLKFILESSPKDIYLRNKERKNKKRNVQLQQKAVESYFQITRDKKLNIGCGNNILPGWLNTDLTPGKDIVYLDARKKFPFNNECFDYVFSEHLFEHLNPLEQKFFLKECLRILKPKGVCRIATPDMGFLFELYSNPHSSKYQNYIYWAMGQTAMLRDLNGDLGKDPARYAYIINSFFKSWGHEMIHNKESISNLAVNCGFDVVRICEVGKSKEESLNNIERHQEIISSEMNEIETMVVELIKK